MIDPPPAPMEDTATVGVSTGNSATCSSELSTGRPSRTTPISALVPPTSKVIRSADSHPASRAASAAPLTPAAGPDSSATTGRSCSVPASSAPPLDRAIRAGVPMPRSSSPALSRSAYDSTSGLMPALIAVSTPRSYSRA